jgi:stage II sporulation protein AA (anti-sigma F factor antagonist)
VASARVDVAEDGGFVRIAVAGEIDLANVAAVEEQIVAAITNQVLRVSVDLGEVDYLDSAGLRIFFSLARRLRELQIALELVAPVGSPSRRVIEVSGLASLVPLQPPMDPAG